ncbi:MAG: hypothetical protein IKZ53_03320 [Selenomonadaceae bacterium]|nr:hypothetical protein [Selenomonadaceae bacterium]
MNEDIKKNALDNEILDDEALDQVSGGTGKEIESDLAVYAGMIGKDVGSVNLLSLKKAFTAAGVNVEFNTEDNDNIYKVFGTRVSRYEALVLLGRGCGNPTFDFTSYLKDSTGKNNTYNRN